jgi:hypothetical protein
VKFRAHETFFIRKGWINKGLRSVTQDSNIFISKEENPMDVLGIGSNMVKSLRYWLQAVGLTEEPNHGRRIQTLTDLGQLVYEHDRYIEEIGTLQLLHYRLATNFDLATAWYFFFNEFNLTEFTREDFIEAIQKWIAMLEDGESVAVRSLADDFQCIMSTYLPRYKTNPNRDSPENNIDCPLGELGLIDVLGRDKKNYKKSIPTAESLCPYVLLAIIAERANGREEIGLNELLTMPCNIGRVFNLDAITMLDALYRIEKLGSIRISRTAGLDVIRIIEKRTFLEWVGRYYQEID